MYQSTRQFVREFEYVRDVPFGNDECVARMRLSDIDDRNDVVGFPYNRGFNIPRNNLTKDAALPLTLLRQ